MNGAGAPSTRGYFRRAVDFRPPPFFAAVLRPPFFAAALRPPRFAPPFFAVRLRGTLAPFSRASLSPIAIACSRLFTFRPLRPLFSVPFLRRRIALARRRAPAHVVEEAPAPKEQEHAVALSPSGAQQTPSASPSR